MRTSPRPQIAVFGSSTARESDPAYRVAYELGRELATAGADVMTGGYSGVMEACSRGAHEAGGQVVGVTVELFEKRGPANRWVTERVHTRTLFERLEHLITRADGFVVATGSVGTLAELMLTWNLLAAGGRPPAPLVLMGRHWHAWIDAHREPDLVLAELFRHLMVADTPAEAARLALGSREV
ncbi:MAG: LOG family protein [Candidatus Eisenbacteria bacterium]|uniref:LOG family protein n=1 Tax=Eiseniibacteriota bacterium TaxID=2212470 RepID=A0A849SAS1_UNCEI|nr:LOG family protein [Candidatus Eisenbacteria bacterium]